MSKYPPISYSEYLKINELTKLQSKRSEEFGHDAHDEMLFIIVHQTYELWFKQILTELDLVHKVFAGKTIEEKHMGDAVAKLERVVAIMRLIVEQISVLETMTPLDFLEFRNFLYPASGFQSVQWRLLENRLGLDRGQRLTYNNLPYTAFVSEEEKRRLVESESQPSLFVLLDQWLARMPFLKFEGFDFWKELNTAVSQMFDEDRARVESNALLQGPERERNLKEISAMAETFRSLLDPQKFEELRKNGHFRMSHQGILSALFVSLYRDEPILSLPFKLLTLLQDVDELMTTWRYRHALMVHRMIGMKIGTGGSTGAQYLKSATETHRIFTDLFHLSTYLIPKSKRPNLPAGLRAKMNFSY